MLLKSRASLTCFRACFVPGRAKDLSAPRYQWRKIPATEYLRGTLAPDALVHTEVCRNRIYVVVFPNPITSLAELIRFPQYKDVHYTRLYCRVQGAVTKKQSCLDTGTCSVLQWKRVTVFWGTAASVKRFCSILM